MLAWVVLLGQGEGASGDPPISPQTAGMVSFLYLNLVATVSLGVGGGEDIQGRNDNSAFASTRGGCWDRGQRCALPSWIQIHEVSFYGIPVANGIYIFRVTHKIVSG